MKQSVVYIGIDVATAHLMCLGPTVRRLPNQPTATPLNPLDQTKYYAVQLICEASAATSKRCWRAWKRVH